VSVPGEIEHVSRAPPLAPDPALTAHWVAAANALASTETHQLQKYVGEPVVGIVPETNRAWSTSRRVAPTVGAAGAVRAGFTVSATAAEVALARFESVTT